MAEKILAKASGNKESEAGEIIMANIDWESRAKVYRIEKKRANKKTAETTTSRDFWKKKAMDRAIENKELKKQLSTIKKNLKQILEL